MAERLEHDMVQLILDVGSDLFFEILSFILKIYLTGQCNLQQRAVRKNPEWF